MFPAKPIATLATALPQLLLAGQSILTEAAIPGASVAIIRPAEPPLAFTIGTRDLAGKEPLQSHDRFLIYSITKLLLAATTLRLCNSGQLALDQAVTAIIPTVALPQTITIRHLLRHTGGLPDYGALPEYQAALRANPAMPWTDEQFLTITLAHGLRFAPDTNWAYSNIGFLLIRQILTSVTGQPLSAIIDQHWCRPLGLQQTAVYSRLEEAGMLIPGWSQQLDPAGPLINIAPRYHPGWVSHGVVASTAADVAQIVAGIIAGPLLPPATRAALLTPTILPFTHPHIQQPGYGLGTMFDLASPYGRMVGHEGAGPGYAAAAYHLTDLAGIPTTIVALLNRDHDDAALRMVLALAAILATGAATPASESG